MVDDNEGDPTPGGRGSGIDWHDDHDHREVVTAAERMWTPEPGPSRIRLVAVGGAVVIALVVVLLVAMTLFGDDSDGTDTVEAPSGSTAAQPDAAGTTEQPAASQVVTTEAADEPAPASTTAPPSETSGQESSASDGATAQQAGAEEPAPAAAAPETTSVPTTAPAPTSSAPVADTAPPTYDTLPDGQPAPILAIFDTDRITLTGAVPSEEAQERLRTLALANAKPGQGDNLIDETVVVSGVPAGIGVRVVELTSTRFPEGRADVVGEHAEELNRIATVMNALPKVTALVIGHADQRGDDAVNFEISRQRAEAVVLYLTEQGISPDRLASRAVGENDLLTLEENDVAYALNRRTEFVLYGLLIE